MAAGTTRGGAARPTGSSTPLSSFGTRGDEATSLDALAGSLDVAKQTILYWFPSKDALLAAVIDRSAAELAEAMQAVLDGAGDGWDRIEAVVRSVFRLAARRPELLGLVREVAGSGRRRQRR